ncbi:peptidoglycan DD-metalloendopeptidase family protein [uncultured Flavobacterium sp.]|uniref:murein hydrolase activator EnvC family protein n=1 Tax=uncultured Flavobacterium sp. TaxID=165435 RepID=UPI0030CA3545
MKNYNYILTLFFAVSSSICWAQPNKQQELEIQREKIINIIAEFNGLLRIEKKKEKSVLTEIKEKNNRIALSQNLIQANENQVAFISKDIVSNQKVIKKLNNEIQLLKEDYKKMIVKAYKSRSQESRIMFVLSSQNFYQAYKRMQYMKQYADFRKTQAEEIKMKQNKINEEILNLKTKRDQKEKIIEQTEKEKEVLESQKKEKEQLVKTIQKDKKKYLAEIDKKEKQRRAIDKQIKKALADAIAAANKKAAEKAKKDSKTQNTSSDSKTTSSSTKFILTAEGKVDSDNFKANKGKLPLPVEKGYISSPYGDHPHPVHKNLMSHNNGIEITTQDGSIARAVFAGEVTQIQVIPGTNKKIIYIVHGDFFTIYQDLDTISVKTGDKVTIKQKLGKIHTNSDGKTTMKFFITQNTTYMNPSSWLSL